MKSLIASLGMVTALTAAASAADLPRSVAPVPAPAYAAVPAFTWTGFYAGINAGYAFSDNQYVRSYQVTNNGAASVIGSLGAARLRSTQDGFTGGGQVGYNYQFGVGSGVVVGIEADAAYTDLDRTRAVSGTSDPNVFGFAAPVTIANRQSLDFLGTVRGRIGYAFDRVLVYGTGGFAYGNVNYSTATVFNLGGALTPYSAGGYSRIDTGYAYGGGIEYALPTTSFLNFFGSSAVTLKAEYLRYDLGRRNVSSVDLPLSNPPFVDSISRFKTEGNVVRAGLNYKFGSFGF